MPRTKRSLSQAALDALEVKTSEYEVPDPAVPGLWYRVYPSGAKSVVIRYRAPDGKQRRLSVGKIGAKLTLARAQNIARERLLAVARGEDPSAAKKEARKRKVEDSTTVTALVDAYLTEHVRAKCKPRTVEGYEILAGHVRDGLGSIKVKDLERKAVADWHRGMGTGKDARPGASNRALSFLSATWNHAVQHGVTDRANPCTGIQKFKESLVERYLDEDERGRLARTITHVRKQVPGHPHYVSPGAVDAIEFLEATGMRLGEVLGLTWSMVDFANARLYLPDEISKTGKKTVYLSDEATALLKARKRGKDLVFTSETGDRIHNIQRAWRSIRKQADLTDVRLHDLRHAYASTAINSGVPLEVVGKLLGHRQVSTTKRYAHLADAVVEQAAKSIGKKIKT